MTEDWLWPAGLALLGAVIGSFVATLAVRWPAGRSAMRGRSACDSCGRTVRARDLIPLASALWLRGRCRYCRAPIDARHVVVEVLALLIGLAAGVVAPRLEGVAGAVFGWLLLALAALDLAALWLPDRLTGLLAVSGLVTGLTRWEPSFFDRLIGGACGLAGLWLVGWSYRQVRGREGLGGGDPKLFGAIGLWVGWTMLPAVLLVACLVGLGVVAWRLLLRRQVASSDAMPFGTLLAAAAYPAWLVMVAWRS